MVVRVSLADPIHSGGRQQQSASIGQEAGVGTGSYEHGMSPNGTHRNVGEPAVSSPSGGVEADNSVGGRGIKGLQAVGPTHSRGVGGVTPTEAGRSLEGVGKKAQLAGETVTERRPRQSLETRLADLSYYSPRGRKALNLMCLFSAENLGKWYGSCGRMQRPALTGRQWRNTGGIWRRTLRGWSGGCGRGATGRYLCGGCTYPRKMASFGRWASRR